MIVLTDNNVSQIHRRFFLFFLLWYTVCTYKIKMNASYFYCMRWLHFYNTCVFCLKCVCLKQQLRLVYKPCWSVYVEKQNENYEKKLILTYKWCIIYIVYSITKKRGFNFEIYSEGKDIALLQKIGRRTWWRKKVHS